MNDSTCESMSPTLLEQLDQRQNEVMEELDHLNQRIEDLLATWLSQRAAEASTS